LLAISERDLRAFLCENQADMATNGDLTNALTALAAAISTLTNQNAAAATAAAPTPPAVHTIVLDPFESNAPLDLSTRTGSTAFATACAALEEPWNGNVETFPAFIISPRIRAGEVHWNSQVPTGILDMKGNNLLTDYHSVTDVDVKTAVAARVNPRAVENTKAMYKCVKASITRDLHATIFNQADTLPTMEDGPTLFKKLTTFTMVSSLQLSMLSFKMILEFDPSAHRYDIPTINTKLNHLFFLATTRERTLAPMECVQHTITAYARIKQPEQWAHWVRNQADDFDQRLITIYQAFMNSAVIKYNKISESTEVGFSGASTTLQEDIIALHRRLGQSPQITKSGYFNKNIIIFESVDKELNR
jgi:hypothetical protein